MRSLAFILIVLFVTPLTKAAEPVSSDSLSIDDAVRLTLEHHPAIKQARSGLMAAEARVGIDQSERYPQVSLSGDYTRLGPVASIDLNGDKFLLYPADNFDFHVGLNKTLYDFGRTATSVKLAETERQGYQDNIGTVQYRLAYRTISACNAIIILHKNIAVIQDQIDALNQHIDVARKRVKAGTATDFDVLTTQVRVAGANDQKIEAMRSLQNQEIALRELTGLPADQPMNLSGDFSVTPISLNPDSLVLAAETQRPEMKIAKDAEDVASVKSEIAGLGKKPRLALNVTTGLKNGYIPNLNTLKGNYTAGLIVNVPLFDGYHTRHKIDEANANLTSARDHTSDLQNQITAEVRQAISGVNSSRDKIDNAELQLKQAQQALTIARSRYDAGAATNLDLLDAETSLTKARLVHWTALYDYTMSLVALDKATGKKIW
jgi:outer membrane protein